MRLVYLSVLLLFSHLVFGQVNKEKLIGKWVFHEIKDQKKLEPKTKEMLLMFYQEMTVQFSEDGLYKFALMNGIEEGRYTLKKSSVIMASNKGSTQSIDVSEISATHMTISLGKGDFVMKKLPLESSEKLVEKEKTFKSVPATKEQICKRWYFVEKESKKEVSEKVKEAANEIMKDTYFEFLPNGKYETMLLFNVTEKGKWTFGNNNESIIAMANGGKKEWFFIEVTENRLILGQGIEGIKWTFETR